MKADGAVKAEADATRSAAENTNFIVAVVFTVVGIDL